MSLTIKSELCGSIRLVAPHGRLDTETSSDLELFAHDQIKAGESHFVIDLGAIDYVSSAGLRVLLMMAKSLGGEESSLRLSGLSPHVKEVFDIAGFTQLFKLFATMEEAVKSHPAATESGDTISETVTRLVGEQSAGEEQDLASIAASLLGAAPADNNAPQAGAPAAMPTPAVKPEPPKGFFAALMHRLFGRR